MKLIFSDMAGPISRGGGGGGGVSESMDGRGCAILALELVPKNLFYKILCFPVQQGKLERATSFVSHG